MSRKGKDRISRLAAGLFWLLVWQIAAMAVSQEILLVSPLRVLARLGELMRTRAFFAAVGATLLRIMGGFVLAMCAGTLLAVLTARFAFCKVLFAPLLGIVKATPVASFILLALVWMHTGFVPVFISFLMVLPVVWSNVEQGILQTDPQLLEMARAYGFGGKKLLYYVYVPSILPYFRAALTTGLGMGWKSGVAAEVICLPKASMGRALYQAKLYLETPDLLAWTVMVVCLSMLIEWGLCKLMARLFRTHEGKGGQAT